MTRTNKEIILYRNYENYNAIVILYSREGSTGVTRKIKIHILVKEKYFI